MPVRGTLVLELVRTTTAAKRLVKMEMTTHRFPRVECFGYPFQTVSFAFGAVLFVSPSGVTGTCAYDARAADSVPPVSARYPSK